MTINEKMINLSWIAQVAFYEDILEEGASIFWLPVLRYLTTMPEISKSELVNKVKIPTRMVNQTVSELKLAGLVEIGARETLSITDIGNATVRKIDSREKEFLSKLRDWLASSIQSRDELSDLELQRFLRLLANWGEEEAEVFNRLLTDNGQESDGPRKSELKGRTNDNLSSRMLRLIVEMRKNRIQDDFARTLTLHSFVYWVVLQAFHEGPVGQLKILLKEKKICLVLDTNVLLGLVVETDPWHEISEDLLSVIQGTKEKGGKLDLLLLASTIDEFRYTAKKVGSRLRSIRQAEDEETVSGLMDQTKHMGLFLEFFNKVYSWGYDYTRYRDHLYASLGRLIDRLHIKVVTEEGLGVELADAEKSMPELRRFEEQRFGYADDDRIRHKLKILALVEVNRHQGGCVPLVWTYNRRFRVYEEKVLGSRAHCVDTLRLQAILREEELFDRGAVRALRRVIKSAYAMGVDGQSLEDLTAKALQYYRHYLGMRQGSTVSGQAREQRVTLRDHLLRDIVNKLSRMDKKIKMPEDGLDYVFETE